MGHPLLEAVKGYTCRAIINGLQPRVEANELARKAETVLQVVRRPHLLCRVGPVLHIAPVDVDLSVRKVPPAAGHQAAQVVLVQVRDDNRVELVAADSACGERVWQLAGLPERASGTGVDQDATLAILDEILVEHEADAGGPRRELGPRLDLLCRATGEVAEWHVAVAVGERGDGEAPDADLRQRRDSVRGSGGGGRACDAGKSAEDQRGCGQAESKSPTGQGKGHGVLLLISGFPASAAK